MPIKGLFVRLTVAAALLTLGGAAWAETAKMLPPGKSRLRYQPTYGWADSRFDDSGKERSFSELNEDRLARAGLPSEVASVYRIDSDGSFSFIRHDLYIEHGLTKNIGLGLWTQYQTLDYASSAHTATGNGWALLSPAEQELIMSGSTAVDQADRSASGPGDTVLGFKHRLYGDNTSSRRFAYWLGLRLPTGHVADPLDSSDLSIGDGQTDLGLWFAFDVEPTDNLLLSLHTRHEYPFSGNRDVIDPAAPDRTLSMDFQPGFYHYAELWALYTVARPSHDYLFGLRTLYESEGEERRQRYNAASGGYEGSLQAVNGTDSELWRLQPEIGLNLFPSRIPISTRLYYGMALQGKNALAADYAGLRVDLYW